MKTFLLADTMDGKRHIRELSSTTQLAHVLHRLCHEAGCKQHDTVRFGIVTAENEAHARSLTVSLTAECDFECDANVDTERASNTVDIVIEVLAYVLHLTDDKSVALSSVTSAMLVLARVLNIRDESLPRIVADASAELTNDMVQSAIASALVRMVKREAEAERFVAEHKPRSK